MCKYCGLFVNQRELNPSEEAEITYLSNNVEKTDTVKLIERRYEDPEERYVNFVCPVCSNNINYVKEFWLVEHLDGFRTTRWVPRFDSFGLFHITDEYDEEE